LSTPSAKHTPRSLVVFRKEFREIFRDRRTVFSVVISPLILTPLIFAVMGLFMNKQMAKMKAEVHKVGIVNTESAPQMTQLVQAFPNLKFTPVAETEAENKVKDKTFSAVLVLPKDADAQFSTGHSVKMNVLIDEGSDKSQGVAAGLREAFRLTGNEAVKGRMREKNLPEEYAEPFKLETKPIAASGGRGLFILSMMLPYILSISILSGAIYAAFDQVAGEKERGTLETLLVSPASRRDIVAGKFSAVVAVCMLSGILTVAGLAITFMSRAKAFAWLSQGGMNLSPSAIGVILLVMLPLSILFAGLLLAISTFARNQKEAQTYLAPLFMIIMLPAMASMIMTSDTGIGAAFVPVLNTSIIVKQALNGNYNAPFILTAIATSALYATAALFFVAGLFRKESVLMKA
jgi:sodium transport system permease protein